VVSNSIGSFSAAVVTVVGLIILLVTKELADASERPALSILGRHIAVLATPLLIVFAFIVITVALRIAY
jgi:uncharacterized membrane protein